MTEQKDLTQEELRGALTAMHHGLMSMQARLDDHEKVIENCDDGITKPNIRASS